MHVYDVDWLLRSLGNHGLTEVNVVVATPLPVHLIDKEARDGFEQQTQDGHAHAEAECVP